MQSEMKLPDDESIQTRVARYCANHSWRVYQDSKVRIVSAGLVTKVIAEFDHWIDACEYLAKVDELSALHRPIPK